MLKILTIVLVGFLFMSGVFALSTNYYFADELKVEDVDVFFGKEVTEIEGTYRAKYNGVNGNGKLVATTEEDTLIVKWNKDLGITVTQDDQYATKILADAKVIHNGIVKYNQPVYIHYSRLSDQLVIRGRGFRFAINQ